MKLYRPVGFTEMDLILNTGNRRFPPRLPSQPIFYPVMNREYAIQIAGNWNTKDKNSGYVGYVTEFEINDEYMDEFEIHQVGSTIHRELWVPSEELEQFNKNIIGNIFIVEGYYGDQYDGKSLINTPLINKNYIEQLVYLNDLKNKNLMDFVCEVLSQWKIITQNYILWKNREFIEHNLTNKEKNDLLLAMKKIMKKNIKWFIREDN